MFAADIRRQRASPDTRLGHWRWHLDKVYVEILERWITKSRDKAAALAFMKKVPQRHGSPEAITTDGQTSEIRQVHANIYNHFNLNRHLVDRQTNKVSRSAALAEWQNLVA